MVINILSNKTARQARCRLVRISVLYVLPYAGIIRFK